MQRFLVVVVTIALCACGANASRQDVGARKNAPLPTLAGQPVLTVPLNQAPPAVQRLYADANAFAKSPLFETWPKGGAQAASKILDEKRARLRSLVARARALAGESPRFALFSSIIVATTVDSFATRFRSLPLPPSVKKVSAEHPDAAATIRALVARKSAPIFEHAHKAYNRCARLAPVAAEALRGWETECRARAAAIAKLIASVDRTTAPKVARHEITPETLPPECRESAPLDDPQAPPPDDTEPMAIAIIYDGSEIEGRDRERLIAAVARQIDALRDERIIPSTEVRRAQRLRKQRRWSDSGPVCGQPPPLPALLAKRHPNLVMASVSTGCDSPTWGCHLGVSFDRPGKEGELVPPGFPDFLVSSLGAPPVDGANPWIAAAAKLVPEDLSWISGRWERGFEGVFHVAAVEEASPWLRIAPTLEATATARKLARCYHGDGVASFFLAWTISAAGEVTAATAEPLTDPLDDQSAACIADVLRTIPFPCTPSAKPADIEARVCIAGGQGDT